MTRCPGSGPNYSRMHIHILPCSRKLLGFLQRTRKLPHAQAEIIKPRVPEMDILDPLLIGANTLANIEPHTTSWQNHTRGLDSFLNRLYIFKALLLHYMLETQYR